MTRLLTPETDTAQNCPRSDAQHTDRQRFVFGAASVVQATPSGETMMDPPELETAQNKPISAAQVTLTQVPVSIP